MYHMRMLILVLLLFPMSLFSQGNDPIYTVQIGTFMEPDQEDFAAIRQFGHLYTESMGNNLQKVFLGGYTNVNLANRVMEEIQNKGYLDAVVQEIDLDKGQTVYVIQLSTETAGQPVDWSSYLNVGNVFTVLRDNQIKVVTGPYTSLEAAKQDLNRVRNSGFETAFPKPVNSRLLHPINPFHVGGQSQTPSAYGATQPRAGNVPQSYGAESNIMGMNYPAGAPGTRPNAGGTAGQPNPVPPPPTAAAAIVPTSPKPDIRSRIKRGSALELQKLMKKEGTYKMGLDGYYGAGTKSAFETVFEKNPQINKYYLLATQGRESESASQILDLQFLVAHLWENPDNYYSQILASNKPIAKGYRAYMEFLQNGPSAQVNDLMNQAIRETFPYGTTPFTFAFDPKPSYSYSELVQLLSHLRYLHEGTFGAIEVPCWFFQRHPQQAFTAFKPLPGSTLRTQNCGGFMEWEEVKTMVEMAKDWSMGGIVDQQKQSDFRNKLSNNFLAPTPLSDMQQATAADWNRRMMSGLNGWAARDPYLAELSTGFKILYYQSMVLMEDYFMDKGLNQKQAQALSLDTLRALLAGYMQRFA